MKYFDRIILLIKNLMDYKVLRESSFEVFWLTFLAFIPLFLSVTYESIKIESIQVAAFNKTHPSELLAFCISFLAPSIFFLRKTHGSSYKLPFIDFYFFMTIFMYFLAGILVFVVKNNIDPNVVNNLSTTSKYLLPSTLFLLLTICFRVYSTYHSKKSSDFLANKEKDQENFNQQFKNSINVK